MLERDRQRIEEERRGVARPAPRSRASEHLALALDAFDDACAPEAVLTPRRTWPLKPGDPPNAWRTLAGIQQSRFCCTAALFTAFAAEAFVNDFLAVHLKPQISARKFKVIDRRWSTVRKFVEGVQQAYGRLFWDGDEIMGDLRELFGVRNRLVHAKPGVGPPVGYMPDPSWRKVYPPRRVARWLVAVAGAANSMEMRCYGFDYQSLPASAIWFGRRLVYARAEQADPLPSRGQAGRPPLIQDLYGDIERNSENLGDVPLTVHELRDARVRRASQQGAWDTFTRLVIRQEPGQDAR